MANCLVTGGAGFIGACFARTVFDKTEDNIFILDALTYAGNLDRIADLLDDDRVGFIREDICNSTAVSELFQEHDFGRVVHFAAESHVDRSILGPEEFIKTNIEGTFNLLESARSAWAGDLENHIFLHVSTDEVYGTLKPDDPAFTEENRYKPNSPYSASKAASDHLARAWFHTFKLPVIISNCSNNYGQWQYPEKLIPLMILNAIEEKPLPVYGDGMQVRDWLHVEDHCEALLTILEKGRPGECYNIGGDNEQANIDIVKSICDSVDEILDRDEGHSRKLITHVDDRPGHDRRYAMNIQKISAELGWAPKRKFEPSMKELVQWYLEHKEWADNVRSADYHRFFRKNYIF